MRGLRWVVEVVALRPRRSAPAGRAEALTEVERINRFSPSLIPALGRLGADRFARLPAAVAAGGRP